LALFADSIAGVVLLNWLVPWSSGCFGCWLQPAGSETQERKVQGITAFVALYGLLLLIFSRFPQRDYEAEPCTPGLESVLCACNWRTMSLAARR
jgi:hypothetical protein